MYHHISFSPDTPPRAYLGGTEHNLPFVKFSDDVSMLLDLATGAGLLRLMAAKFETLADEIDVFNEAAAREAAAQPHLAAVED